MKHTIKYRMEQRTFNTLTLLIFIIIICSGSVLGQTYQTIANGNWNTASTWQGGVIPSTSSDIPTTAIINIRHTVSYNTGNTLKNGGTIRIQPTSGTVARLTIPTNINIENLSTGKIYVINGSLVQFRFVGGGNSGVQQSGTFKNIGGYVRVENGYVETAQDWTTESGGIRVFINSCLKTGQNFSISGSTTKDTMIATNLSIGWHGSGNFQLSDGSIYFSQTAIQLAGTSGNFQLSSGIANGDIDYITLRNHVTSTTGGGEISASSSLIVTGGLNLDAYCVSTSSKYIPNGKFSGTQLSDCNLTTTYFPGPCGNPVANCTTDGSLSCTDDSVEVCAGSFQPGVSYAWSGPGNASSQNSRCIIATISGTYTVVITGVNGTTATCSTSVGGSNTPPELSCSNDGPLTCLKDSVNLTANSCTGTGITYSWTGPGGFTSTSQCPDNAVVAGDYIVTATQTSNGCFARCTTTVAQTNTPPELSCSNDGPLSCLKDSVNLTANSCTGTGITYSWTGPGGFTSTSQCPNNAVVAGDYIVTATQTSNGCFARCTTTVAQTNTPPELSCSNDGPLTCLKDSVNLTANSCTGTGITYSWTGPGGFTSTSQCPNNAVVAGDYIVTATQTSNGCFARCTTNVERNVVNPLAEASNNGPLTCSTTTVTLTARDCPQQGTTYEWDGPAGFNSSACSPTVSQQGTYTLTVTSGNGCTTTDTTIVTKIECPTEIRCSLTQGFYGNIGGKSCATGEGTLEFIQSRLLTPLVIGKPGKSLTITSSDAACLIKRLPGSGPAKALPSGNHTFDSNCNSGIPLKNDKFNNVLLGQTITLGLNLRLDNELGSIVIEDNWLITMGADPNNDGYCGTSDDVQIDSLTFEKYIPESVIKAMIKIYGSATVNNLFDLANKALGGEPTSKANAKDITIAVSSINEAFDHCTFLVGFQNTNPQLNRIKLTSFTVKENSVERIKAYPNPFIDNLIFEIAVPKNMNGTLELYTSTGTLVATIYTGVLVAGKDYKFEISTQTLSSGLYLYKFTNNVDDGFTRKIILAR